MLTLVGFKVVKGKLLVKLVFEVVEVLEFFEVVEVLEFFEVVEVLEFFEVVDIDGFKVVVIDGTSREDIVVKKEGTLSNEFNILFFGCP